jgi:hypothetical protein
VAIDKTIQGRFTCHRRSLGNHDVTLEQMEVRLRKAEEEREVLRAQVESMSEKLCKCANSSPPGSALNPFDTGGKGAFTQWVHCEFIVSSETICPANTQWVCAEYFLKVPTKVPSRYFVKETLEFFHNSLTKVPTGYFVKGTKGFFHNLLPNVPIKEPEPLIKSSFEKYPFM